MPLVMTDERVECNGCVMSANGVYPSDYGEWRREEGTDWWRFYRHVKDGDTRPLPERSNGWEKEMKLMIAAFDEALDKPPE